LLQSAEDSEALFKVTTLLGASIKTVQTKRCASRKLLKRTDI
jgi:hypothetical protein